ncbi:hypothetical protein RJT34_02722 [Clitoria ternatea]|uniref:Uncharacterized protein n=1 Tax=Clitoria ternatea TaxID=43366 RepID=A0AAN9KHJ5_CLITE
METNLIAVQTPPLVQTVENPKDFMEGRHLEGNTYPQNSSYQGVEGMPSTLKILSEAFDAKLNEIIESIKVLK